MDDDFLPIYLAFCGSGVVFVIICILMMMASAAYCGAAWRDSGLQVRWEVLGGCQVRLPDGRWLPSDRVREIDIKPQRQQ